MNKISTFQMGHTTSAPLYTLSVVLRPGATPSSYSMGGQTQNGLIAYTGSQPQTWSNVMSYNFTGDSSVWNVGVVLTGNTGAPAPAQPLHSYTLTIKPSSNLSVTQPYSMTGQQTTGSFAHSGVDAKTWTNVTSWSFTGNPNMWTVTTS